MPVSRAMMMTSDRTTSTTRSNTGDQRLLAHDGAQRGMFVDQQHPNRVQLGRAAGNAELLSELADDAPVCASVGRRRRATLLVLEPTLEIGDRSLALVRMRHWHKNIDARVVVHWLGRGQE